MGNVAKLIVATAYVLLGVGLGMFGLMALTYPLDVLAQRLSDMSFLEARLLGTFCFIGGCALVITAGRREG